MNAQNPDALRLADALAYCDSSVASQAARELLQLHAENEALQQVYDARQLEIDNLRGVTKSKLLAQPVAWMVYLPSIDTQHLYYSQEDMGYVDDVTNHADAEVTPLYEMAAPKAEVAPSGEYPAVTTEFINKHAHPSQAAKLCRADWSGKDESSVETVHPEVIKLLHAYADATCAMRAQADSQPAEVWDYPPLPDFDTVEQHIYGACRRYITQDMLEPIHNLIRDVIDAARGIGQHGTEERLR